MFDRVVLSLLSVLVLAPAALAQRQLPLAAPPPVTTVLPADVPGVLLVNMSEPAAKELTRYDLFASGVPGLRELLYSPLGVDFKQAVQPWVGDRVAIALLPQRNQPQNDAKANFGTQSLVLAPIKNMTGISQFTSQVQAMRGQPPVEQQYKGIKILAWAPQPVAPEPASSAEPTTPDQPPKAPGKDPTQAWQAKGSWKLAAEVMPLDPAMPPEPAEPTLTNPKELLRRRGLAIAILPNNYLATATTPEAIQQLIDLQNSPTSLAQNPLFQRTLRHPQFQKSHLVGYGNLAEVAKISEVLVGGLESVTLLSPEDFVKTVIQPLSQDYSAAEGLLWTQPEGLRAQMNAYYKTPQPQLGNLKTPEANKMLARLPAQTYLAVTSRNLKDQWRQVATHLQAQPAEAVDLLSLVGFLGGFIGLDIEKDVIPWMDGEYATFLFPTQQGLFPFFDPQLKLGMGVVIQTSNRAAAEKTLKQLNQHIKTVSEGAVTIANRKIKGIPITSWELKEGQKTQSIFAHGWLDQKTLLIATGSGPLTDLSPKPTSALPQSYTFKTATQTLPQPNHGYFYLNSGSFLSLIYAFLPGELAGPEMQEIKRALGTVRSVSGTAISTPEKEQSDSLLVLAPAALKQ